MSDAIVKYTPETLKRIGSGLVKGSKKELKKAGKLLIASATDSTNQEFASRVTGRVKELITHRNALYIAMEKTKKEIQLFDDRIKAIETGEFTIGWEGYITFNDKELQGQWH